MGSENIRKHERRKKKARWEKPWLLLARRIQSLSAADPSPEPVPPCPQPQSKSQHFAKDSEVGGAAGVHGTGNKTHRNPLKMIFQVLLQSNAPNRTVPVQYPPCSQGAGTVLVCQSPQNEDWENWVHWKQSTASLGQFCFQQILPRCSVLPLVLAGGCGVSRAKHHMAEVAARAHRIRRCAAFCRE